VLVLFALGVFLPSAVTAAGPYETDQTGTTRTIEWTLETPESLALENVALVASEGVLAWQPTGINWSSGADFIANGSIGSTIQASSAGLELRGDTRNHVSNGGFDGSVPWTFENASSGQTTAIWEPLEREARFRHMSDAAATVQWDSLDTHANWFNIGFDGTSVLGTAQDGRKEGVGMMSDQINTLPSPSAWAGALRMGPFNWSGYDRLVIWIKSPVLTPFDATFNVTAFIGTNLRGTSPLPLLADWREYLVDLTDLGADRSEITQLTLRFNGPSLEDKAFYLDDIRLVATKRFTEAAAAHQSITKADATAAAHGTSAISYDWVVSNATGIASVESALRVSGPLGSFERWAPAPEIGVWAHETADVSAWISATGSYTIRIEVRFAIDTNVTSDAAVSLDNVTLQIPGRANGTYLSFAIDVGARSHLDRFLWDRELEAQTSVRLSLRVGGSPTPGDSTWGGWGDWDAPGAYPFVAGTTARYAQVSAELGTLDATRTPRLTHVALEARHRSLVGTVTTDAYAAGPGFAGWRGFEATWNTTPSASIRFDVSGGAAWTTIAPGADLRGLSLGPTIRLRSTLATTDGLDTPRLSSLRLVYDVVADGGIGRILTDPLLLGSLAAVGVGSLGYSVLARRRYGVEDLFLVARDGRLILHNTNRLHADRDEDLFAGMLTAMSSFVKDTFKEERGGLRQFAVGGKEVLIERVDSVFLAAIYSNRVPRWAPKNLRALAEDLQRNFGERLRQWSGSSDDLQDLRALTDRFLRKTRYRRWPFPGRAA